MSPEVRAWFRPAWGFTGVLVAYYALPLDRDASVLRLAISLLVTGGGLGILAWMMALELHRVRTGQPGRATGVLTMLLVLVILSFSLTFYLLNVLAPGQVAGLSTRTDALYFTLSTMTTVGYGDVHAQGQVARAVVCGLIVFTIVVIASLAAHARFRPPIF